MSFLEPDNALIQILTTLKINGEQLEQICTFES